MKITRSNLIKANITTLMLSCAITNNAWAGDYYLFNQTATQLGIQSSGAVAGIPEAGALFYNPAGLSDLTDPTTSLSALTYSTHVHFKNQGSIDAGGATLRGKNGGNAGLNTPIPTLFVATPLDCNWSAGIGLFTPFGLGLHYDKGWVGRYTVTKVKLETMNINPSISYKFNESFLVGAGVSAEHIKVRLSRDVDFGAIGAFSHFPGVTPQSADGSTTFKGHNWGYGVNVGAIFKLNPETRFGLSARSGITHKIKSADVTFAKSALGNLISTLSHKFNDSKAKLKMKLPSSIILGFAHDCTKELTVRGDITWMNWKRFKELRVKFANPLQPDDVTPNGYKNSFIYTLGASYKLQPNWMVESAIAYDQSPVKKNMRHPVHPDSDKINLSFGTQYDIDKYVSLSASYLHAFCKGGKINVTSAFSGTLNGKIKESVDIFGAQLTVKF